MRVPPQKYISATITIYYRMNLVPLDCPSTFRGMAQPEGPARCWLCALELPNLRVVRRQTVL